MAGQTDPDMDPRKVTRTEVECPEYKVVDVYVVMITKDPCRAVVRISQGIRDDVVKL